MSDVGQFAKKTSYRAEIQGLRAVAALLVGTYHIWFGRVSGGVDVFFVVSAFLITKSLLKQIETTGRVHFLDFWGGLARRLLPAAMLVLLTVAIASVIWLPRTLWAGTIQQTFASILYVENWLLALDSVDYLAQGQPANPVQHYWALSTQAQFYLLWPIIVAVSVAAAARFGARVKTTLVCAFAAILLVSLTFSIVATRDNQAFTYFNTFARLWELCLGALLAVLPKIDLRKGVRVACGWIGLTGIIACGAIFQVSQVFPGYAALWPVACAMLIIVGGTSGSRFGADRLLGAKPLVYLGGISYGLYLWHWPVLIFYRWSIDQTSVALMGGLGVLAASIALAAISTRFIENPLRFSATAFATPRRFAAFFALGLSPVLLFGLVWGVYFLQQKQYDERPISTDHPDYPGALAMEDGSRFVRESDIPLYPGMLAVQDDLPVIYKDGCYRPDADWQRHNCVYGDPSSSQTLALVGGSHSVHWLPALDLIAKKHGWRIVVYTKSNCLFSDEADEIKQDAWCVQWNERALTLLLEDRPQVVFTTATRGSGAAERVPGGFLSRWDQLRAAGITVIAIRDTPWMKFWVPECLEVKGHSSPNCAQTRETMLASTSPVHDVRERPSNVYFIDLSEYFCDERSCPPTIGNVIVYRDDSHITQTYSRTLAPMLSRKLSGVLPPGWMKEG